MPSKRKVEVRVIGQPLGRATRWMAMLLLGATAGSLATMQAQAQDPDKFHFSSPEVAVTYDVERAKISPINCGCFWFQGGSVDVAVPFYKGWSIAGSFEGAHASNIQPGVDSNKLSYLAGPRYTVGKRANIFGEALFGGVHGFDSIFPAPGAATSSANSYAMQFGGGVDIPLGGGLGLRAVQVDYVRTALPNNGTNTQNDLHLAFGISYRFNKK